MTEENEPHNRTFSIQFKRDISCIDIAEKSNNGQLESFEWRKSKEMDFLFASRLIQDARDVRNINYKKTRYHLSMYENFLRREFVWIINITMLIYLLLAFIEKPSDIINVEYWIPCTIELICLIIFFLRWLHLSSFQTPESFWTDKKNWICIFTIIISAVDLIAFWIANAVGAPFIHRYTRWLRVAIYINFNEGRELRRAFRNVRKTLPDILNVFTLFIISLFMFSFLGWQLLKKKKLSFANEGSYFINFEDSLTSLYVLVTTANFPDIMMPAYDNNWLYSLFFIMFIAVNLYIFMNIILATIFINYKKHLKEEVRQAIILKRGKSSDAFEFVRDKLSDLIISEPEKYKFTPTFFVESEHTSVIIYSKFERLIKYVYPKMPENQIKIIFRLLDSDENNLLTFKEFVYLPDLLNYPITEVKDRLNLFEKYVPKIYNSKFSNIIKRLVNHRIFQYFFDLVILMNLVFIVVDSSEGLEWLFLTLFCIEIILKMYACGFKNFFQVSWNIFDIIVVLAGVVGTTYDLALNGPNSEDTSGFEVILILRSLRLIKLIGTFKRFRIIIDTIAIIIPSLLTYLMLVLTIFYVFSMIGLEFFGNVIKDQPYNATLPYNCHNEFLTHTDFTNARYCKNNFSNFPQSLVLLFELMVVNQWHILMRGFEDGTRTKWTRLYFVLFHIICVTIILNIFTAFVIEAFLLEYESHNKISSDTKLEKRIIKLGYNAEPKKSSKPKNPNESYLRRVYNSIATIFKDSELVPTCTDTSKGVRFHLNSRKAKAVEILLQRMFSSEFDIAEEDLMNSRPSVI